MTPRRLHDGRDDGLRPLESLDLNRVRSFTDLMIAMQKTSFAGRQIGNAYEIFMEMARDSNCFKVLTLSGAMTIAKQGLMICEMIDRGLVQAIVATGALMAHGLTESIGLTHYATSPDADDTELFQKGYNRVYDTLEMEANLNDVEVVVRDVLDHAEPESGVWSSARFCRAVGQRLEALNQGPGILRSAWNKQVPVFIPAFTDSEMGLDFSLWAVRKVLADIRDPLDTDQLYRAIPSFNPFLDLQEYARLIGTAGKLGILTIGGGVPRNWAQQVAPYYDITAHRLDLNLRAPRFQYGIRICPEPVHWGGLSGCTYKEGVSWGKFLSPEEGGRFAEVFADATAVWPLLMKAVFETLDHEAQE
ncbi:deoxyhypusine synthase family protein [bacterium]|nr:deoxyhypusine synthase family protein [candidate division CSSED10-310 bacterium]